jgi:hypothetical protein
MGKRQQRRAETVRTPSARWHQTLWAKLSAAVAAVGMVVINLPAFLDGAEKSPAAFERVINKFQSWYYEDAEWSGLWSAGAEGYVDSAEMDLSAVDLKIHLMVENGHVGGELSGSSICKSVPFLDYLLLDGEISWGRAVVTAFDYVDGKRQDFFRFTAKREGAVLIVTAENPKAGWIPAESRIAFHPDFSDEDIYLYLQGSCAQERTARWTETNRPAMADPLHAHAQRQ